VIIGIIIKYQGKEIHKGKLKRSILNIYNTLKDKGDALKVLELC
jgi:hypothetical protein|tara:strand:- start:160 stop:291 length:132 start_codon:yes stop_codon:yes gene_type:complete